MLTMFLSFSKLAIFDVIKESSDLVEMVNGGLFGKYFFFFFALITVETKTLSSKIG